MKRVLVFIFCLVLSVGYSQISVPYFNNFDNVTTDTIGWVHSAINGVDDWEIGEVNGVFISDSYTGNKGWVTNLDTSLAENSVRYLETPYFSINTPDSYVVEFDHRILSPSSSSLYLQYQNGSQGNWYQVPSSLGQNINHYWSSPHFSTTSNPQLKKVIYNLDNLPLSDSIKFRFKIYSNSVLSSAYFGWIIEGFSVREAVFDYEATNSDTIRNLNKNFDSFTFNNYSYVTNELNSSFNLKRDIYLSVDSLFSSDDSLLLTYNPPLSGFKNHHGYGNNFNIDMPDNLTTDTCYIFIVLDSLNDFTEIDETNNMGVIVMILDPIIEVPIIEDFDSGSSVFKNQLNTAEWGIGTSNWWNIEKAHSSHSSAYTYMENTSTEALFESSYVDLSESDSTNICFFYRKTNNNVMFANQPNLKLDYSSTPLFVNNYGFVVTESFTIPNVRMTNMWDCYCVNLEEYDSIPSTKFRFSQEWTYSAKSGDAVSIDDIYIGKANVDYSIEGNKSDLFTKSTIIVDTLYYYFYNSGLLPSPTTTTKFYWSTDSLFDNSDIYLGENAESTLNDTSFFLNSFVYTKMDNTIPKYYIFYSIDVDSLVSEMREYNNIGYFEVFQSNSPNLPYANNFEVQIDGWRHNSTVGVDDWNWGVPSGSYHNEAFSGTKAWVTSDTGYVSNHTEMHLYTPIFDLTQLNDPVLEFNLSNQQYNALFLNSPGFNIGNIYYSTDGGAHWIILNHTSNTKKRLYLLNEYKHLFGQDLESSYMSGGKLIEDFSYGFTSDNHYNTRDYFDDYKVVVDLAFLNEKSNVQFKVNFANNGSIIEGLMLDDFKITEALVDLKLEQRKNLLVNSTDEKLNFDFGILNDGGHFSSPSIVNFYLSEDSLLNPGDVLLSSSLSELILPYKRSFINKSLSLNSITDYSIYNYLLFEIDAQNIIQESDETNNLDFYYLNMDSLNYESLPYSESFSDDYVDGWTWQKIDGWMVNESRFRNKTIIREPANFAQDNEMFLDPMDLTGYYGNDDWNRFPTFYLEVPVFDFSGVSSARMSFDLICEGSDPWMSGGGTGGGMECSVDGGSTWFVLLGTETSYFENWYYQNLESLNDKPGWFEEDEFTHVVYDLSHFGGEKNVSLRFKYRSSTSTNSQAIHGLRVDNFLMTGTYMDFVNNGGDSEVNTLITDEVIPINLSVQGLYNVVNPSLNTYFYWSEDSIFSTSDELIKIHDHYVNSGQTINLNVNIVRPDSIFQLEYYLFSIVDGDSIYPEISENNNVFRTKIIFDNTNLQLNSKDIFIDVLDFDKNIEIASSINTLKLVEVYDLSGKLVISKILSEKKVTISKKYLAKGIYIVKVYDEKNNSIVRKISKFQ